ncbi:MAG: T9SS type A sorting domain-containing protein [Bacteroidia bacterium]
MKEKIKEVGLVLLLVSIISFNAKSQYAIAQVPGAIYVNITPDTLLNPISSHNGGTDDEYYYIDINQDGNNDIEIVAQYVISPGEILQQVYISSLDTASVKFSLGVIDSLYPSPSCGWFKTYVLKQYNILDTIKNGIYVTQGDLGSSWSITCGTASNSTEWVNSTDHCMGVKFSGTTGISYGWVRFNVTNFQTVLIKDFSLGAPFTGIQQYNINNKINVYPNPAANKVQVALAGNNKVQQITLCDVLGKEVASTKETAIDVSILVEGIYFIKVETTEGIETKKIIIQR